MFGDPSSSNLGRQHLEQMSNVRLRAASWRLIPSVALLLSCLVLIIWAGAVAWQWSFRAEAGVPFLGTVARTSLIPSLLPVVVALGFWMVGSAASVAGETRQPVAFFLVIAGVLATGKLSDMESDAGARLFYLLLAWLAPLTIRFYIVLLGLVPCRKEQFALGGFSLLAALASLPVLIWSFAAAQQYPWFGIWRAGVRLGFVLAFVLGALWLARDYQQRASLAAQRRIRLVAFATLFAFAPLFLLSLLPDTLHAPVYVAYELTFPWLLLSPLAYEYAQFRHRLVRAEAALSRMLVRYLTAVLLVGLFIVAIGILDLLGIHSYWGIDEGRQWLLVGGLVSAGAAFLLAPLQTVLQSLVNWVLYGHEIRDAGLAERLSASLVHTLDRQTLRHLLVEGLPSAMGFSKVVLFLRDKDQVLSLLGAAGFDAHEAHPSGCLVPTCSVVAKYLEQAAEPVSCDQLFQALAGQQLQPEERALLSLPDTGLWLPLVSDGVLQGLLLIGIRQGDAFFTAEDRRILSMVARQAGIAAHNLWLLESVRSKQEELTRMHRHLLIGYERERLRLARELHDSAIQQLLGVSRLLESMKGKSRDGRSSRTMSVEGLTLEDLRQETLRVVRQLRELSSELRPAWLRELGLTAAVRGEIERRRGVDQVGMHNVELDLDESGTALPEPVAICLFRVAQEALRNTAQHAHAHRITLRLRMQPDAAVLQVRDDGCGFRVPAFLSELTQDGHFGLAGMVEQVEWLGGSLIIQSQPGAGTEVTARVPLSNLEEREMI